MKNIARWFLLASLCLISMVHAKNFKVINCEAVTETQMNEIITFCNAQLPFDLVAATSADFECKAVPEESLANAVALKTDQEAALVVLVNCETFDEHQLIDTKDMVAVINVKNLKADDPKKMKWRLERMVLRCVASLFGIPPAPDPYCVTRDYKSLDDLDAMGRNYTPPYNLKIEHKAKALGINMKSNALPFGLE